VARWLTALLVLAPALAGAAPNAALHVSATVVRSLTVTPEEAERRAGIRTGIPNDGAESPRAPSPRPSPPADAGGEGESRDGACAGDATCVVVTIHADGEP
jgi:hypothetical protein